MNKFSVIIPTLLKCVGVTNQLLDILYNDDAVDEVIIIDNVSDKDIRSYPLLMHPKTTYLIPGENIYVNPAWNWGVSVARNDNIILGTDDIIIPDNIVSALRELDLKSMGLLGIAGDTIHPEDANVDMIVTDFALTRSTSRTWGYGVFMVLHKDNYYVIPNDIKVWAGDDLNYHWQIHNGRFNYFMHFPIKTKMSTTSDLPEFDQVKQNDLRLYHQLKF